MFFNSKTNNLIELSQFEVQTLDIESQAIRDSELQSLNLRSLQSSEESLSRGLDRLRESTR